MPAPGDQHLGNAIRNPFEEVKPRISQYTAGEIATLSAKLEKQLGPEYISSRAGPGGGKVHYLAAEKCIQLANEVFGFNGWSSQIMDTQVDFVEEKSPGRIDLGMSVTMRVTLRDGTFHEDVGYGHIENCKSKAAAFEKAKKEGTTDGLKRALRSFGNVLGNCIYDKEYLKQVGKVKAVPTRIPGDTFEIRLHRHPDFVKREVKVVPQFVGEKKEVESGNGANGASAASNILTDDTLIGKDDDDEYGDFDEADLNVVDPNSHPDEVVLQDPAGSRHFNNTRIANSNAGPPNQNRPSMNQQRRVPSPSRPTVAPTPNNNPQPQLQPQTPKSDFAKSSSGAGPAVRLQAQGQQQSIQPPLPQLHPVAGRVLHQPNRNNGSNPPSPVKTSNPNPSSNPDQALPPPGAGFVSSRAVAQANIPEAPLNMNAPLDGPPPPLPPNLMAFNPHAESPSIRKTPGLDHKSSKPIGRDGKTIPPGNSQAVGGTPGPGRGSGMEGRRMIGAPMSPAPGMGGFSGGRGAGGFKAPTMKRNVDGSNRVPLNDLSANGAVTSGGVEVGGDAKRQRIAP